MGGRSMGISFFESDHQHNSLTERNGIESEMPLAHAFILVPPSILIYLEQRFPRCDQGVHSLLCYVSGRGKH
jgi:hypothetical protein